MQPSVEQINEKLEVAKESDKRTLIAVYNTHEDAEKVIREVEKAEFDMQKLSIAGKDYQTEKDIVGFYNTGDSMKAWGRMGAFWGSIWGSLVGSAFFQIPGFGPLLVAGPLVSWIVVGLENETDPGRTSVIDAALRGIGIPADSISEYETQLKASKFIVIAHGRAEEISGIESAFALSRNESLKEHAAFSKE